ncbi:thioredoxin family protein [Bacillus sp. FJAT-50079]|uniref:thioredoxin family protein n=1 Tax=Bacillus sp. FJAT-50079 TaxID=2833577 RepID=UPI001BC9FAB3|nr:thioredoxin family protein [Bacillus sp. FJAT-50079]MBS4210735.1 thioredoxin family protein [Bacillus sp. FJAT-50079]
MKKVIIFLAIFVGLFAVIALITKIQQDQKSEGNVYQKESLHPATIDQLDDPNYQNIILPDELEKKLNNKEDVTVYFFSSTCSFCKQTTPIINPVAKELDIDLVQYNLLEFPQGSNEYNIESTPTVVHFVKGKEQARIVGAAPKEDFKAFFEKNVK